MKPVQFSISVETLNNCGILLFENDEVRVFSGSRDSIVKDGAVCCSVKLGAEILKNHVVLEVESRGLEHSECFLYEVTLKNDVVTFSYQSM